MDHNFQSVEVISTGRLSTESVVDWKEKCPICLGKRVNNSFTDSCYHEFCFSCLTQWANVKPECPLCKKRFKKILYNIRSMSDYDIYEIKQCELTTETPEILRDRARLITRYRNNRFGHDILTNPNRYLQSLLTENFRRLIYELNCWVIDNTIAQDSNVIIPINISGRVRVTTPEFYRSNPACMHRLYPWLFRELNALNGISMHVTNDRTSDMMNSSLAGPVTRYDSIFGPGLRLNTSSATEETGLTTGGVGSSLPCVINVNHVVDFILYNIRMHPILSSEFRSLCANYVNSRFVDHFIHEFRAFASSPVDNYNDYDAVAFYQITTAVTAIAAAVNLNNDQQDRSRASIVNCYTYYHYFCENLPFLPNFLASPTALRTHNNNNNNITLPYHPGASILPPSQQLTNQPSSPPSLISNNPVSLVRMSNNNDELRFIDHSSSIDNAAAAFEMTVNNSLINTYITYSTNSAASSSSETTRTSLLNHQRHGCQDSTPRNKLGYNNNENNNNNSGTPSVFSLLGLGSTPATSNSMRADLQINHSKKLAVNRVPTLNYTNLANPTTLHTRPQRHLDSEEFAHPTTTRTNMNLTKFHKSKSKLPASKRKCKKNGSDKSSSFCELINALPPIKDRKHDIFSVHSSSSSTYESLDKIPLAQIKTQRLLNSIKTGVSNEDLPIFLNSTIALKNEIIDTTEEMGAVAGTSGINRINTQKNKRKTTANKTQKRVMPTTTKGNRVVSKPKPKINKTTKNGRKCVKQDFTRISGPSHINLSTHRQIIKSHHDKSFGLNRAIRFEPTTSDSSSSIEEIYCSPSFEMCASLSKLPQTDIEERTRIWALSFTSWWMEKNDANYQWDQMLKEVIDTIPIQDWNIYEDHKDYANLFDDDLSDFSI